MCSAPSHSSSGVGIGWRLAAATGLVRQQGQGFFLRNSYCGCAGREGGKGILACVRMCRRVARPAGACVFEWPRVRSPHVFLLSSILVRSNFTSVSCVICGCSVMVVATVSCAGSGGAYFPGAGSFFVSRWRGWLLQCARRAN